MKIKKSNKKVSILDATNQSLGRLAVEVSIILRGKHKPDFVPYKDGEDFVEVHNIQDIKITGKKMKDKMYRRHSTRPGSLKEETMEQIIKKHGKGEILRRAVYGMLPKNKLRDKAIKRLIIK